MKRNIRLLGVLIALVLVFGFTVPLSSCGIRGGTIIVENNSDRSESVDLVKGRRSGNTITDVKEKGSATIPPGASKKFHVNEDGSYHVMYYAYRGSSWGYQLTAESVSVSGGDTVTVRIP
jgi:hypothetical protein